MPLTILAAADAAQTAGAVFGRLLFPLLGAVLLTIGLRRRRDPATQSRGTGFIVAGSILLGLGVLGLIGSLAVAGGSTG